jgi:succinylglutamic semialdehyde dehydrogenase
VAEKFISFFVKGTSRWRIAYYQDPESQMGPLVSETAMEKFLGYQKLAKKEGAQELLKGAPVSTRFPGFYISPSIHFIKKPKQNRERRGYRYDEIFGPDVAVYLFDDLEEAIDLHNDSRYGLVASVFTRRKSIVDECYRRLEIGMLHVNRPTVGSSPLLPFCGIKASGNHFPAGSFSPYYCTYPVAIQGG